MSLTAAAAPLRAPAALRAVPGEGPVRGEVLAQLQARVASDFAGLSERVQAAAHERRRVSPAVRAALRQTAWALARIEAGHYGTCTVCGAAIDTDRLRACPTVGTGRACDHPAQRHCR
jgi:RNA polymerase-binding transcription factor DksA